MTDDQKSRKKRFLSELSEQLLISAVRGGQELDGILITKCIECSDDYYEKLQRKLKEI